MTQQETIESISNYGIMVVLSALVVIAFTILFVQVLKRQDRYDNKMTEVLEGVTEALFCNARSQEDSAREKSALAQAVENSNELIKQAMYMYHRAMEKNEQHDEFLKSLKEDLIKHGLQQEEIMALMKEIHAYLYPTLTDLSQFSQMGEQDE